MQTLTKPTMPPPHSALSLSASPDDTLSALFDGELPQDQARSALIHLSPGTQTHTRFEEYCAIRDILRGQSPAVHIPDFTQRVMTALESEPTVLAPMRKPANRNSALWLAAAAVSAITWGLWSALPTEPNTQLMAAAPVPENMDVSPYLAAHQDFAQAVLAPDEMNFTQVSLAQAGR